MSNDDDKRDERDETTDSGETDSSEGSNESASGESDAQASSSSEASSSTESSETAPIETAPVESGADDASSSAPAAGKGGRMSAGARLAAAKAAKAVVKAAKKEERKAASQTEVVQEQPTEDEAPTAEAAPEDPVKQLEESELGRAALKAGRWWESNQQMGWVAVAVAALAIVGFLGWQYHNETTSAAAGTLLADALEIASARIEAADAEPPADDDGDEAEDAEEERTFPTRTARDEAALEAYQAVISQYPTHPSAGIARLGAARTLLALGRNDEALEMYQEAFDRNGGRSGTIAWQALEGVAFAQEAAGNADEARATYERLAGLDDHAYEQVANYHLARLMLSRGERDEARTALRELVDSLRAETVEGSSEPRFPYLLAQAEVRLRELDPSSATSAGPQLLGPGGGEAGGPGGGGDIDPAQLQELIRQFQAQQQGGGGGEGGGE